MFSSDYDEWLNDPDEDAAWDYLSDEALNNLEESMSAEVTVTITVKGTKLELTLAEVRQLRRVLNELAGGDVDSVRIRGGEMPTRRWPDSPGWGITNSSNGITLKPGTLNTISDGESDPTGFKPPAWKHRSSDGRHGYMYDKGDIVEHKGKVYESLWDKNWGREPDKSEAWWEIGRYHGEHNQDFVWNFKSGTNRVIS